MSVLTALTAAQLAELRSYGPNAELIAAVAAAEALDHPSLPSGVKATTYRHPDGRSDAAVAASAREQAQQAARDARNAGEK